MLALKALYPDSEKWNNEIMSQFHALFEEYYEDVVLGHMGFPKDWALKLEME